MSLPWQQFGDVELKAQYASLIRLRPATAQARFEAALLLFPGDDETALALQVASNWPTDPVVLAELDRLNREGQPDSLPSFEETCRNVFNIGNNPTVPVDDRLKAYKLYADMRGFTAKNQPQAPAGNTYIDNRKVYVLPAEESLEDWEAKTIEHQAKLVADASS